MATPNNCRACGCTAWHYGGKGCKHEAEIAEKYKER